MVEEKGGVVEEEGGVVEEGEGGVVEEEGGGVVEKKKRNGGRRRLEGGMGECGCFRIHRIVHKILLQTSPT